jgi:hypothetical protein
MMSPTLILFDPNSNKVKLTNIDNPSMAMILLLIRYSSLRFVSVERLWMIRMWLKDKSRNLHTNRSKFRQVMYNTYTTYIIQCMCAQPNSQTTLYSNNTQIIATIIITINFDTDCQLIMKLKIIISNIPTIKSCK